MTTAVVIPYDRQHARSKKAYIKKLLQMLKDHPLDRKMGDDSFIESKPAWVNGGMSWEPVLIGGYSMQRRVYYCQRLPDGVYSFFGNFFTYSYAFNFYTDEQDIIKQVTSAIKQNQRRADYLAQDVYKDPNPSRTEYHTQERIIDWHKQIKNERWKVFK